MRPNILFIMADQFRADALGCVGGYTRTPNLDSLARDGALSVPGTESRQDRQSAYPNPPYSVPGTELPLAGESPLRSERQTLAFDRR